MTTDDLLRDAPNRAVRPTARFLTPGTVRLIVRWILAGPAAILVAVLFMAATPFWFPEGASGVDHIVIGLLLFPAYWALAFFYALMEDNVWRATLVLVAAAAINAAMIAAMFNNS